MFDRDERVQVPEVQASEEAMSEHPPLARCPIHGAITCPDCGNLAARSNAGQLNEEQVQQLTSKIGTAAALFTMEYYAAKQAGNNLMHGLDSVIEPILRDALLRSNAGETSAPQHGPGTQDEVTHLAKQIDTLVEERQKLVNALEIVADRIDDATEGFIEGGKYVLTYSEISNELRVIIAANQDSISALGCVTPVTADESSISRGKATLSDRVDMDKALGESHVAPSGTETSANPPLPLAAPAKPKQEEEAVGTGDLLFLLSPKPRSGIASWRERFVTIVGRKP